jgi:hypothetical protein
MNVMQRRQRTRAAQELTIEGPEPPETIDASLAHLPAWRLSYLLNKPEY